MIGTLQIMPSRTATAPESSDTASPPARSAAARFFNTTELILVLLEYLHHDRIDLLTIALVCKQLRVLALQIWIRHFDFDYEGFENKLKLVQANRHLLAHIRCLRISNCEAWHRSLSVGRRLHRPPSYWSRLKTFLSLLAAHTTRSTRGPLLDITIDTDDGKKLFQALGDHPKFTRRVAAFRIIDCNRTRGLQQGEGWASLTLLLKNALSQPQTDVSLRVIEYRCYGHISEADEAGRAARVTFWSNLAGSVPQSLHKLRLQIGAGDPATSLLRYSAFASLKHFELTEVYGPQHFDHRHRIMDAFLHRHADLQELVLNTYESESSTLALDQTFPALRVLELGNGIRHSDERTLNFLRRHPGIRIFRMRPKKDEEISPLRSLLAADLDLYKHLPGVENTFTSELGNLIRNGARPLRAHAGVVESTTRGESSASNDNYFSDLGFKDWDGIRPEHVEDLTYLQVEYWGHINFGFLIPTFHQLFTRIHNRDSLPALTELHIKWYGVVDTLLCCDLFRQLIPATSLRILCIQTHDGDRVETRQMPAALLTKYVFPIRFELLCWRFRDESGSSHYFRFLADSPEKQDLTSAAVAQTGKIGRLQAVPKRTVLTQVSKDGVWHDKGWIGIECVKFSNTILDHSGDARSAMSK